MPVGRRLVAATAVSALLLTGLSVAAAAEPIIPGQPTPLDDVLAPEATGSATATPTTSSSATPTATATTTATPTATPTATATATATATPTATASPTPTPTPGTVDSEGLYTQPRSKCLQFADAAGDATTNPISGAVGDPDDDLDIIGVAYKTTSTALQVFVLETKLDQAPSSMGGFIYDTHSFSTGFTIAGKVVSMTAGQSGPATATVGGAATTILRPTATFDVGRSQIVFSVLKSQLATLIGHDIAGADLTALNASSAAESSFGLPGFDADSAAPATTAPASQKAYSVGDNTCFTPPPALLALSGTFKGVYTDITAVTANLKYADGIAIRNVPVRLQLSGQPALVKTTDNSGNAIFVFPVRVSDGMRAVTVSFAGNSTVGAATVTRDFVVRAESTVIKATSSRGSVTAKLTDNDGHVLPNHVLVFTVGKKVTKLRTNANGVAVLTRQAKGATAKVAFGVVPRFYYAARPVLVKVA